uniref:Uncharacterized protein n=1 Tax=Arundo donax TaxID=35708 RepID=A0A0A9EYC1_ARUDO
MPCLYWRVMIQQVQKQGLKVVLWKHCWMSCGVINVRKLLPGSLRHC